MFQINDVVVYGAQGVCKIVGTQDQKIDGANKTYFVLKPADDRGATFYVPTWNEKALAKMRKVMTKQDVDALIDSMPNKKPAWIENENERRETYKRILAGGNQAQYHLRSKYNWRSQYNSPQGEYSQNLRLSRRLD